MKQCLSCAAFGVVPSYILSFPGDSLQNTVKMNRNEQIVTGSLKGGNVDDSVVQSSRYDEEAFDEVEEKKLIRKIDWRLLPILGALYSIALIDRTNVSHLGTPVPISNTRLTLSGI